MTDRTQSIFHTAYTRLLRWVLPLAITVAMVWYLCARMDLSTLWQTMRTGVRYGWILGAMALSVLSHILRAMRWRLQLRPLGVNPGLLPLSCAIFGTYALNLVLPRAGELWRCHYVSRTGHIPFAKTLGTMVADRMADSVTVLGLLGLAALLAHTQIARFMHRYPMGEEISRLAATPSFWVVTAGILIALGSLIWLLRRTRIVHKATGVAKGVWQGFASVASMEGKWAFALLTGAVWGCYFLQLYLAFMAMDCTRALVYEPGTVAGLLPCLVAFTLSSVGMAIPSQGGLGPWNLAIVFALGMYGVCYAQAASFSIVVWGAQTIMLIALGIFTAIYTSKK